MYCFNMMLCRDNVVCNDVFTWHVQCFQWCSRRNWWPRQCLPQETAFDVTHKRLEPHELERVWWERKPFLWSCGFYSRFLDFAVLWFGWCSWLETKIYCYKMNQMRNPCLTTVLTWMLMLFQQRHCHSLQWAMRCHLHQLEFLHMLFQLTQFWQLKTMWHGCLKDVAGEEIRVSMETEDDYEQRATILFWLRAALAFPHVAFRDSARRTLGSMANISDDEQSPNYERIHGPTSLGQTQRVLACINAL